MEDHNTIQCPVCGSTFNRALYDFDFIHCNIRITKDGGVEAGCGTFFDKKTGEVLPTNKNGQVLINILTNEVKE